MDENPHLAVNVVASNPVFRSIGAGQKRFFNHALTAGVSTGELHVLWNVDRFLRETTTPPISKT